MNLFEHRLWEETKKWLIILIPLLLIFLFINPLISLVLLFIIFARLIYVKSVRSTFDKAITQSQENTDEKLNKMITNVENQATTWTVNEILKLTKNFPDVFIDFIDEKNEYVVTYRNQTVHFRSIPEMKEWLTVNFKPDKNS